MTAAAAVAPGALRRFFDGDVWHSIRSSRVAMAAALVALICIVCSVGAELAAPHNPFDLKTLDLADSVLPPAWLDGGQAKFLLGTDEQGRDVLSALMYGARISLFVGGASVVLSLLIGVSLGLLSGYVGGYVDGFIMRVCDVMLSFPSILIALLISGVGRALFPNADDSLAFSVLIIAIALTGWVQYARTVRGSTLVERNKEYVQAARIIGGSRLHLSARPLTSCSGMYCPMCSARCSCSLRSRWPPPYSPKPPCHSSVWAFRPPRPRWVRSSTKATSNSSAAPGGW